MAQNSLGLNMTFPIKQEDGTSFHDLILYKATSDSVVMSLGDKITGDVYYKDNTLDVTMSEYIEYKANPDDENEEPIHYILVNPPTIVREGMVSDNSELKGMTKYSFEFYHPMYQLGNFPFTDVATTSDEEKYLSENKSFSWIGKPQDFIDKLNKNLQGTVWYVRKSNRFPVEKDDELSEVQQFDKISVAEAIKKGYEIWEIPYIVSQLPSNDPLYAQGKRFVVEYGLPSNEIYENESARQLDTPFVFHMGQGVGLKNNSRTPRNNKIVTRIAGFGSEDNIPYGYPQIVWTGNQDWEYTINNDANDPLSYPIYSGIVGGRYVKLIKHPFTRSHLMPSIFSETVNKKVNPNAEGYNPNIEIKDYYDAVATQEYPYPNEINHQAPSYENHEFEDIKPELDSERNTGIISATPLNNDLTPADHWDDEIDDNGSYIQSYFKIKLPQLSFDLYACAAITQEMQVNMRSGSCIGCTFTVSVDWDDYKNNFYDVDGNFAPDGSQRNLDKYPKSNLGEIEIILQKDNNTFGKIMPNVYQQPNSGDLFVFIGISLPTSYIKEAEERLDDAMKSYMLENNVYYFDYPLKFDEYFLATHKNILGQIHPNSIIHFDYSGEELQLYVKQLTVKYGNNPLPQYDITLTDNIEITLNQIGQVASDVEKLSSLISILRQTYSRNVWAELSKKLSKVQDDTAQGFITFLKGLQVGNQFVSGLLGEGGVFRKDEDGKVYIEADKLYIRTKAYFDNVEIKDYEHTSGNRIASKAGMKCVKVEAYNSSDVLLAVNPETEPNGTSYYRCYFRAKDGEETINNDFVVGDQAFCDKTTFDNNNLSHHRYWRLVVGKNGTLQDDEEFGYIDLSASDKESGSNVPLSGDDISQLGNRNVQARQGAIIEYVGGDNAPSYQIYQNINSYSLEGKNVIDMGFNSQTGRARMNVAGDFRFGSQTDNGSYIKYDQSTGTLKIKANVEFTNSDSDLDEFVQSHQRDDSYDDTDVQNALKAINGSIGSINSDISDINGDIGDINDDITGINGSITSINTNIGTINNSITSINATTQNLQDQIDGAITTYFMSGVPTLTNAPASSWTTDIERNKHINDLYYDKDTGYGYHFLYDDSEKKYKWVVITDKDVTKALADAAKAQATADGKRTVYSVWGAWVQSGVNTLEIGDLFIPASDTTQGNVTYKANKVYKCTTKGSNAFREVAYTDDTKVDGILGNTYYQQLAGGTINSLIGTAQTTADTAVTNAANAQTSANNANNKLTSWANSGKIAPTEILALKNQKTDIENEYAQIIADANRYSVNNASFVTAYNNAIAALNYHTDATHAASDGTITIVTDTTKSYYFGYISAYYSARQTILNAIAAKAKEYAETQGNKFLNDAVYKAIKSALGSQTDIAGGLVLTSLIGMRQNAGTSANPQYVVWGGISGEYDANAKGKGIAAWYGGEMSDKEDTSTSSERPAQSLFRFDGSGYLAGGNISWDKDGVVTIANVYSIIDNTQVAWGAETLQYMTNLSNLLPIKVINSVTYLDPKVSLTALGIKENLSVGGNLSVSGILSVGSNIKINNKDVATQEWVNNNYITKSFFDSLFQLYNDTTKIDANGTIPSSSKLNIKAMFGFWTEQYISALGKNDSSSGSGGNVGVLNDLNDVTLTSPTANQILVFDGTHWKNQNQQSVYQLPQATSSALGGIKIGYTTTGKNYAIQLDSNGKAFVNVPWTDTTYSLPLAASGTRGGIQLGYTQSGKNYPVQLSGEKAYVNVPWENTNTTYSAGTGLSLSGTTFNIKAPSSGAWFNGTAYVAGDGVMEVGRYIDFHPTSASTLDYSARIDCGTSTTVRTFTLPDSGGTILTSGNSSVSKSGDTLTVKINGTTQSLTNTNTTYSAGSGLSLSGTTFSIASNVLVQGSVIDTHHEGHGTITLDGTNELYAFYDRGGTCDAYEVEQNATLTNQTLTRTSTSVGALSANVFNGAVGYNQSPVYSGEKFAVYDLVLPVGYFYATNFFWSFGNDNWKPAKMRILIGKYSASGFTYISKYSSDACPAYGKVYIDNRGTGFDRLRIVVSKYSRLACFGITNYNSIGLGTTYMSRCLDNAVYRNISPAKDNTWSLGTSSKRWKEVRAVNFYGALVGNADTATKATLLKPIASTTTTSTSSWNIPSGCKQVWGQRFSDSTLTYTPSGGSATSITDSGDWTIWLAPNATANFATLNMRIDGTYYGSFSGNLSGNVTGNVTGNSSTATKLQTSRTINGTSFDGSANITTANWGTARNISIADSDSTNTGSAVSVNGSAAVTLKLPSTIKATLNGNASTATTASKLSTVSKTAWGQTFWTSGGVPTSISGALSSVTNITMSGYIKIGDAYLTYDSTNNAIRVSKNADGTGAANFYALGGVSALGVGSSGSGGSGVDMTTVWAALNNPTTEQINASHLSTALSGYATQSWVQGQGYLTSHQSLANYATKTWVESKGYLTAHQSLSGYATETWVKNQNYLTSVGLSMPTGFTVTSSPITSSGTLTVAFSSGYSLVTSTEKNKWNSKQDSISDLTTIRNNASNGQSAYNTLKSIMGEDSDTVINKWNEIIDFLDTYTEADTLANLLSNKTDKTTQIIAGTGLTGGGALSTNRTISLAEVSGLTIGTFTKVTIDKYGRVTSGTTLSANDIPSLAISKITNLQSSLDNKLSLSGGSMTNTNKVTNLNADLLDGYHANEVYKAASYAINNPYTSNTWIRIATITIPSGVLGIAGFTAIFSNRECLEANSFILTLAIRREVNNNSGIRFYYNAIQSLVPDTITLRSDDNITFYVYIKSAANAWTTYYSVTKLLTEGNITYENKGTTSPISGTKTNVNASKGGNVLLADSATNDSDGNAINSTYLKLTGGTLSSSTYGTQLTIERAGSPNYAAIGFKNSLGMLGYLAINTVNGAFVRYNADTTSFYPILDSSNSSVSKSGETLTVKINGTSQSLTNTWRGIQNNLTSSSTTDSLSAYQGYLLANGSARDNTKLPLAGGTLTGNLTFSNTDTAFKGIYGTMGGSDNWRIGGGATASDQGYLEIATNDNANEPIYVRQYKWSEQGGWTTIQRTLTLLDSNGNTIVPGSVTANSYSTSNYVKIGNAYLTYDSTNNAIRVSANADGTGAANFYALGGVSALGASSSGSGGSGVDMTTVWAALNNPTTEQINASHLSTALSGYATQSWVQGQGYLTSHQSLANYATKTWVESKGYLTSYVDTKNTAGSTDTSSKLFLIGATTQGANPQTYSQDTAYVGTDGCLYSGGAKVLTAHQSLSGYATESWVSQKYLPLTGGIVTMSTVSDVIFRKTNNNVSVIRFDGPVDGVNTTYGFLGFIGVDTPAVRTAGNVDYKLCHAGNSSVTKTGETLTVKINNVTQSLTNTIYSAGAGLRLNGTTIISNAPRVAKDSKAFGGQNTWIMEEYTSGANYNLPSNAWYHIMSTQGYNTGYGTQLALGMTTEGVYYRRYDNRTWTAWKSLINIDTTYSAGTGLTLSGTTFYNSGVRAATINGNYLRVNTNGTNADLTIPYANYARELYNSVSVESGNTATYPWRRIATTGVVTGNWADFEATILIRQRCDSGVSAILKISLRTNNLSSGDASSAHATWLVRNQNYSASNVKIALHSVQGKAYADVYLKATAWQRMNINVIANYGWTFKTSKEDSNSANPVEAYTSIEAAATALYGVAYTSITDSYDVGIVSRAISDSDGNVINTTYLKRSGGSMTTTNVVTNLNADLLDGKHLTSDITKPWDTIPYIKADGVMEVGRYFDFHYDNTTGSDFSTRLWCTGNHSNDVRLPSASGTLALTSDNVASATKLQTARTLWGQSFNGTGNVSGNMSGVGSIFANGSITSFRSDNGGFVMYPGIASGEAVRIECVNSSGVWVSNGITLLQNGNVGIGTNTPSKKLTVNGELSVAENATFKTITAASMATSYTDTWSDGTNSHPWYGYDHRYSNTGVYSTTISDYFGMTLKTGSGNISMTNAGNVGIGTFTPSYKLDVNGTLHASGATTLSSTLSVSNNTTIGGTLGVTGNTKLNGSVGIGGENTSYKLYVNGTSYITGRVGIGYIPNTAYMLDVAGKINADSGFIIRDNASITIDDDNSTLDIEVDSSYSIQLWNTTNILADLSVSGDITANGNITSEHNILAKGGVTALSTSDRRKKTNITKANSIDTLKSLGGTFEFDWIDGSGHSIGFIAQNVEKSALNDMVYTSDDGYMKLNYLDTRLISLAVGGIIEVDDEVTKLKKRVKELEEEVKQLKAN